MPTLFSRLIAVAVVAFFIGIPLPAQQSLTFFNINASGHPVMRAKFYASDSTGNQITGLSANDFSITENGIPRRILSISCPPPAPRFDISSVLVIDVSGSMNDTLMEQLQRKDVARAAAQAWVNEMFLGTSECAITSFSEFSLLNQPFTTNHSALITAINDLDFFGGTSYSAAFFGEYIGALDVAARGKHLRHIVFLTDGKSSIDADRVIATALQDNITVHTITIGLKMPAELRTIAEKTGGTTTENITTREEAIDIYRKILREIQGTAPCEIVWESEPGCDPERTVAIEALGMQAEGNYTLPPYAIPVLFSSPAILAFGGVEPGSPVQKRITIKTAGAPVTIASVTIDNPLFTVVNLPPPLSTGQGPFKILDNAPLTFDVRFAPTDEFIATGAVTIATDNCPLIIPLSGGSRFRKPEEAIVMLVAPNGGEEFYVGNTATVEWKGLLLTDTVRLEYSTNGGATWQLMVDSLTATTTYSWEVPNTPSATCLARIRHLSASPSILFPHVGNVASAEFSPNGRHIVTTSNGDAQIQIWNTQTNALEKVIGNQLLLTEAQYGPNGTRIVSAGSPGAIVWDAGTAALLDTIIGFIQNADRAMYSPDGAYIATTESDGAAKLWTAGTRTLTAILQGHDVGPVLGLAFSPDGKKIITAGAGDSVIIWDISTVNTPTIIKTLYGTYPVTFTPNGSSIAITDATHDRVTIYDTLLWRKRSILPAANPQSIDFSTTGSTIAIAQGNEVTLQDITTGNQIQRLLGHTASVNRVRYNNTGTQIVTASADNTARIWNLVGQTYREDVSDAYWKILQPVATSIDVDFGTIQLGKSRDTVVRAYIVNRSPAPFVVDSLTFSGVNRSDFSLVSGNFPLILDANAAAELELQFTPQTIVPADRVARVTIHSPFNDITQNLYGKVVRPVLDIAHADGDFINFGPVELGTPLTKSATITNVSTVALTIDATTLLGPDTRQYAIANGGGTFTLAPNETRIVNVTYTPNILGYANSQIGLEYSGIGSPAIIGLLGEGIAPSLPAIQAPGTLGFTRVVCAGEEALDSILITNIGGEPLELLQATITGIHLSDFTLVTPFVPVTLTPNQSATLYLRFVPGATGIRNAMLSLTSNAINAPVYSVQLYGTKEVIALETSVMTIDLGMLCPNETRDTTVLLTNNGTIQANVGATVTGAYILASDTWMLAAAEQTTVPIHFTGTNTEGTHNGTITLADTRCGNAITVQLTAVIQAPELQAAPVSFNAPSGQFQNQMLTLTNPSGTPIIVSGGNFDNSQFFFPNPNEFPVTIFPGESQQVTVRYAPTGLADATGTLVLIGEPCNLSIAVPLTGITEVIAPALSTIALPVLEAAAGDTITIDVRLVTAQNLDAVGADNYTAHIRINKTLLKPVDTSIPFMEEMEDRVYVINGTRPQNGAMLTTLKFVAALGNAESTPLQIELFSWGGAQVDVTTIDGEFRLRGICHDGGARLFYANGTTFVKLNKNPVQGIAEIEYEIIEPGYTQLFITDVRGQKVASLVNADIDAGRYLVSYNASTLATGTYMYVLQTATQTFSGIMQIQK